MNDMDDKLIQMARDTGAGEGSPGIFWMTVHKLAAFRSAILADAAKDVQVVAWRFRWNPQGDWHITSHEPRGGDGTNKEPLYSATTLAAAQALNAELVARVERLEKDAARLDFVCSSPNRMVERESGLWRVYEDVAPTDHPTAVWQGMSTRWHVSPREAIDAAIAARNGT